MRVTNKIIQNNQLTNINTNKTLQDQLSTQISSGKKIARPSDDPIIALRSLRLRTSVNQTTQYVEKNVEDAKSWLKVTEDAIKTLTDIVTDVRQNYTKATSDTLTPSDRRIIMENLQALKDEIYNTGNVDFAGRSVFTGYRTSETLTFQKNEEIDYKITEGSSDYQIDQYRYVVYTTGQNDETKVSDESMMRVRLSYKNLGNVAPEIYTLDTDGVTKTNQATVTIVHEQDVPNPFDVALDPTNKDKVIYVPETGELLFGTDAATKYSALDFKVDYHKEEWTRGELRPEHYFDCEDLTNNIKYDERDGEIEYNIGVNQTLRINTVASECFNHDIGRDIDDVLNALKQCEYIETEVNSLKSALKAEIDPIEKDKIQLKIDAAEKAQTFYKDVLHKKLAGDITNADDYLKDANLALTNCGTRSKRLELVENRLDTQLSTLNELKSENEDADLAETAIRMSSAQYSYNAALMAAGKILKDSLLNYV